MDMTGGTLPGLLLPPMAWPFFAGGAVTDSSVLRLALRALASPPAGR
jgi:hypothetical protein